MPKIRVVQVSGTPLEMGRQHALRFAKEIRTPAEERVGLCSTRAWTGQMLPQEQVLALAEACLPYHHEYAPDLMEELRGIGEVTGLTPAELLILNGFTDFIDTVHNFASSPVAGSAPAHPGLDNCTAFIVSSEATIDGRGFFGQTWDMHSTATPFVILLHGNPAGGLRFLTLTIMGCVGMIGMNEAGIAIGINNLVGSDGQVGVTWPFVVRKTLAQDNLDNALACITEAQLAGGHNYMLADATGRGFNIEAMASHCHVEEVTLGSVVHTNHCLAKDNSTLERERLAQSINSSHTRLERGRELLRQRNVTLEDLFALTRDHSERYGICAHVKFPLFIETCGAAIMRPATREFWAVWGHPCKNEYRKFSV